MELKGACCVVTGAASGLGRQIALDLANQGAKVYATDINEEALSQLSKDSADRINCRVCNVCDEASVQNLFADVLTNEGSCDVLVNNAGITKDGLLAKVKDDQVTRMPLSDFRAVIEVNLVGVFLCGREAAIAMMKNNRGVIINISSVSRAGNFGQTNYSAAKAGVDAMTVSWSKELARHQIRCAAIAPGYIGTEMVKAINSNVLEKIVNHVPLKRLGEPAEISKTVQFIIENEFVNGKILEIDGGLRI